MAKKLKQIAKIAPQLTSGKLMIGPNERARSQYPGTSSSSGGGGWWGG